MINLFKRKEEKFILSIAQAGIIREVAQRDMGFSQINHGASLIDIRTTYFENDDFVIYLMKKSRQKNRYKIRIREYGKNGKFKKYVWIELKEKAFGLGYKSRFKINRKYINDFIEGKDIYSHIKKRNKGIKSKSLSLLSRRIQQLIKENQMYPRLVIQYQRLALQEKSKKGIRLTFDYNLKGGIIEKGDELFHSIENPEYFDNSKSIVEMKISSINPGSAKRLKKRFNIKKQRFSKFVFGMESFFREFPSEESVVDKVYSPISEIIRFDKEFAAK